MKTVEELTQENVDTIDQLEKETKSGRTKSEKVIDRITDFCGTTVFVWLFSIFIALWVGINEILSKPFDPFPYVFLTLCLSVLAIYMTVFVLITQKREAEIEDRRSHLDLQVNLLSEHENTKILDLLNRMAMKMDVDPNCEPLKTENVVEKIEQALTTTDDSCPDQK